MAVDRRRFLQLLGAGGAALAIPGALAACGGDDDDSAPAQTATSSSATSTGTAPRAASSEKITIGFIALTDCAPVVMAKELGLFDEYGLNVDVVKQASWAATRDNLLTGDIDAAHLLFGLPFSVYTGVGGAAGKEIPIAMVMSNNGQAITLSEDAFGGQVGFRTLDRVKPAIDALQAEKEVTFAMTFPGGTHDLWLRYWLAAASVDQSKLKIITIPPPQMVANMKVGAMDGYSVGEPWNGVGVKEGIGFTALSSQDIWKHHPEKVLGLNPDFLAKRRDDVKLLMRAIIEAGKYIDNPANTAEVARVIGGQAYVNAPADVIDARLSGKYDIGGGLGEHTYTDDLMAFHRDGLVNLPRRAHATWFMAQYVRFGYLAEMPDANAVASKLIQTDLYREVATEMGTAIPDDDMAPFTVTLDGARFDPAAPETYLAQVGGRA